MLEYSLAQPNEREYCHVVADTDDEDQPQGQGEVLYVSQLNDITLRKGRHIISRNLGTFHHFYSYN